MPHSMMLNLSPHLSEQDWMTVLEIYRGMDGWIESAEFPSWYGPEGSDRYITVSAEPSGLQFDANIEPNMWVGWMTVICARLTLALGVAVHDAEM